jgi:superfamily II DNA or RNA helicase
MLSQYLSYKNKYIAMVNNTNLNMPTHKKYEILWAIEKEMILWDDLPPEFGEHFDLPHIRDYGVDLIDLEYTKTAQVKHYSKNSTITWTDITNYTSYSKELLGITNMNLLTTSYAKIDSLTKKLITNMNINVSNNDFENYFVHNRISNNIIHDNKPIITSNINIEQREYLVECTNIFLTTVDKNKFYFQLPCGTGKSYIILNIIKCDLSVNPNNKYVIFVPWIDLVNQFLELFKQFNIKSTLIRDNTKVTNYSVLISTYQSSHKINNNITFKYKFLDEAHHLELDNSVWLKTINSIVSEKELHLSATFKNKKQLDYNLEFRNAIDLGYICDYKFYIEYFTSGEKQKALVNLIKNNLTWTPIFIYFSTTQRAISFNQLLLDNDVKSNYITSQTPNNKRLKIIEEIKLDKINVLCLCGCFNEGVSIDNIHTVIFGDLRHSDINRIQISMRACRKYISKPFYRIVLPLTPTELKSKDVLDIMSTFYKVDSKLKNTKFINNLGSRIVCNVNNCGDDSEHIYREIYNSLFQKENGLNENSKVHIKLNNYNFIISTTFNEKVCVDKIQELINNSHLINDPQSLSKLKEYISKYNITIPVNYCKIKNRIVCKTIGIASMNKLIRNTILNDTFIICQINNAKINILYNICASNNINCDNLEYLISNYETLVNEYSNKYNLSIQKTVKLVDDILFSANYQTLCRKNAELPNDNFLNNLRNQIFEISKIFILNNYDYFISLKLDDDLNNNFLFLSMCLNEYHMYLIDKTTEYLYKNTNLLGDDKLFIYSNRSIYLYKEYANNNFNYQIDKLLLLLNEITYKELHFNLIWSLCNIEKNDALLFEEITTKNDVTIYNNVRFKYFMDFLSNSKNDNDFLIDLNIVAEEFNTKNPLLLRALRKNYTINIDFHIENVKHNRTTPGRGGLTHSNTVKITPKCLKQLCLNSCFVGAKPYKNYLLNNMLINM